jgi:peptidoglycan biosynthesis protein MviN/MurJ (putative lipid II flippase)
MREAWRRIKPFLLGQIYSRTDPLVDRFLTSLSIAGDLSLLYIGQQIYSAGNLVINKAISAPTVPKLASAARAAEWSVFRRIYRQRLLWVAVLTLSAAIALVAIGEPLLHLAIGHGGVTAQNVHMLWWFMVALSGLLIGGCAGQVTSGAFYAKGDTRTPTMLFIVTFTIYVPIKIIVFLRYGVIGLAAATSLHLIINFLMQLLLLEMSHQPKEG